MYAPLYCPVIFKFDPLEFIVTPHVATTVTCHAPSCSMFIIAPTGNATVAFKGTVNVEALAFVIVTIFPASVSTNVYVVPVWSFSCNPVVLLVVVNVCAAVKVFATSFFVVSASYACTSVPMASHNVVLASAAEASSVKLAQNVDMVVLAGKTRVFISASTSLSIKAHAAVTLAVSVTSALASIQLSFVLSAAVNNAAPNKNFFGLFESSLSPTAIRSPATSVDLDVRS